MGSVVQQIEAPGMGDVIVDDFNSDGLDDLAVASYAASAVFLYFQGPDGLPVFPDAMIHTSFPQELCSGDVTNDSKSDLIVLGENRVSVYEQRISDRFELIATLSVSNPRDVAVGNSGSDELNDIFVTGLTGTTVFFQEPGFEFDPFFSMPIPGAAGNALLLAMIDDDELIDVIVASSNHISTYIQRFPNAYEPGSTVTLDETGHAPEYMSVGDLDSDNRVDLVIAGPSLQDGQPGTVKILFSNSSHEFSLSNGIDVYGNVSTLTLVDIENDGTSEILVSLTDGNLSFVSESSGFTLQTAPFATLTEPEGIRLLASGHFNGDSLKDVVVRVVGFVFVIWVEDYPATLVMPVPSTLHLNEGETRENLIDLRQYFYDDYGILDFNLILEEDPTKLDATLSGPFLSFRASLGWSGSLKFQVEAWDNSPQNNPAKSNVFSVWVNDVPQIMSAPPAGAEIDSEYSYQIVVEDNYPTWAAVTYKLIIGSEGMTIDDDGLLTWTPKTPGTRHVLIEVRDVFGLSDIQTFTVEVAPVSAPPPVLPPETPYVAGTAVAALSAVAIAAVVSENVKFALLLFFVPLYSKIRRERVLDHFIRGQIYGYILANPGEHYNAIKHALGLTNGSLAHHLRTLEREEFVKSRKFGLYRRFYPKHMRIPDDGDFRMNPIQKHIVDVIHENPGISQKEIANAINITPPTVNYHIGILASARRIRVVRQGRKTECFVYKS
ncbi:MAG: winged helix-turn-helix transcriptional regulator [Thermoplasmata archaeon]